MLMALFIDKAPRFNRERGDGRINQKIIRKPFPIGLRLAMPFGTASTLPLQSTLSDSHRQFIAGMLMDINQKISNPPPQRQVANQCSRIEDWSDHPMGEGLRTG